MVKANQALIEVKHRRLQVESYERLVLGKDTVISHYQDNIKEYQTIIKEDNIKIAALKIKANEYDKLYKDYKFEYNKAEVRGTFMKIGTPVICVVIGGVFLYGGYELGKLLNK